jgi:hypothetical protein
MVDLGKKTVKGKLRKVGSLVPIGDRYYRTYRKWAVVGWSERLNRTSTWE